MLSNRAYVLISTVPERTRETFSRLQRFQAVKAIDIITGPYDMIVLLEASDADEILDLVVNEIRYIDGVKDTVTCFAVRTDDDSLT